ncbi:hypothetical protein [Leptospira sp. GIMC2001]|uniref:hypothetical protein n=1 Tax=Leptospira sp. GIMC2001 TaxID=1513297 RepID=UPI00234B393C|nr:hypothetical protein [Leptospira sp. GIMC2001]WCL50453.1 hypothetical protein O4O04_06430 [Leptospira sp. GIMC2001]
MDNLKIENFEIKISAQGDSVMMQWLGRSESRNPAEYLNPYLENFISNIQGKNLVIDYTKLEFMNSSTVPPIIKLIKSCSTNDIKVTIHFNKIVEWQNASFKPLQTVCMNLKNIKIEGI